jgi:periplasmic divalent cation tolerance protein
MSLSFPQKLIIGWVSVPQKTLAKKIATYLIKEKLAACVKIIDGIESIYEWENKIEESQEFYLMIKTSDSKVKNINDLLRTIHPYKTYEFTYTNIDGGNDEYLDWIKQTLTNKKNDL